jgi:phospholipase C
MRISVVVLALAAPALSCRPLDDDDVDPGPPCSIGSDPASSRGFCAFGAGAMPTETLACPSSGNAIPIDHVIVLMQENRSFDHYLGHLRGHGQDDVDVPDESVSNPDREGNPVPWHHAPEACFDDPNHSWLGSHIAFNMGENVGFVVASSDPGDPGGHDPTGARAMGFYDESDIPFYYRLASTFATSDRYFADVLGPTTPNRLYLYAGSSFGMVNGDVDPSFHRTIFHELSEAGISWKVYQSDVAAAFSTASFLVDSIGHVARLEQFAEDAQNGSLPKVAFIDPTFLLMGATSTDEGPPSDLQVGQAFVHRQVSALMSSSSWTTSAMFITYDEAGGLYDHVPPPPACLPDENTPAEQAEIGDFGRYGFRVPVFVVSPYAKAQFVSHVVHSHASILRFIEARFGLPALSRRDANADAMFDMFDFANPPFLTPPDLPAPDIDQAKLEACRAKFGP